MDAHESQSALGSTTGTRLERCGEVEFDVRGRGRVVGSLFSTSRAMASMDRSARNTGPFCFLAQWSRSLIHEFTWQGSGPGRKSSRRCHGRVQRFGARDWSVNPMSCFASLGPFSCIGYSNGHGVIPPMVLHCRLVVARVLR